MKLLVQKEDDNTIEAMAYDIEEIIDPESHEYIYILKDEKGIPIGNPYTGNYYIFDIGNDEVLIDELKHVVDIHWYCVEDGCIKLKGSTSLNEIREVKRMVNYIKNTIELNELELLYQISLLILGLE